MINAEIVIDNVNWKKKLKNTDLFINKVLKSFPKKYKFNGKKVILTVLLSNNKKIKKLNKKLIIIDPNFYCKQLNINNSDNYIYVGKNTLKKNTVKKKINSNLILKIKL